MLSGHNQESPNIIREATIHTELKRTFSACTSMTPHVRRQPPNMASGTEAGYAQRRRQGELGRKGALRNEADNIRRRLHASAKQRRDATHLCANNGNA